MARTKKKNENRIVRNYTFSAPLFTMKYSNKTHFARQRIFGKKGREKKTTSAREKDDERSKRKKSGKNKKVKYFPLKQFAQLQLKH